MNLRLFDFGCPLYWQANLSALVTKLLYDSRIKLCKSLFCESNGLVNAFGFVWAHFGLNILQPLGNVSFSYTQRGVRPEIRKSGSNARSTSC